MALIGESLLEKQICRRPKESKARLLRFDGKLYTIVGVIPSFRVLKNVNNSYDFFDDIYVPVGQWEQKFLQDRDSGYWNRSYGRLRAGVSLDQARADTDQIAKGLEAAYPNMKGVGITIVPLKEDTIGESSTNAVDAFCRCGFRRTHSLHKHLRTFSLARSAVRTREFAVRAAVGATRWRIIRQSLTEGILLSCDRWSAGNQALDRFGDTIRLADSPVRLCQALRLWGLERQGTSFCAGAFDPNRWPCYLVPALKISRPNLQDALKESGRALSRGRAPS